MDKSYTALFELLWYSQIPCFDVENVTSYKEGYGIRTDTQGLVDGFTNISYRNDQELCLERKEFELCQHLLNVSNRSRNVLLFQ